MPKKKTTSVKKKAVKKTVKKAVKSATKKKVVKKTVATKPVKNSVKKTVAPITPKQSKRKSVNSDSEAKTEEKKADKAIVVQKSDSGESRSASIVFSLDDVEQFMARKKSKVADEAAETASTKPVKKAATTPAPTTSPNTSPVVAEEPAKQRVLGAASLADILGFNPAEKKNATDLSSQEVPKKWKKYYDLLIELRAHVSDEITLHTSETLKHSSRDDSGDLSSYGTHQADAGTDTFDRDFALSLVSGEQEALNEIEEAILRIKNGTYGVCEVTGKTIPAARLTAVPFARYSVEGQSEYEKNVRRKVDRGGNNSLFADSSDAPKLASSDDDE